MPIPSPFASPRLRRASFAFATNLVLVFTITLSHSARAGVPSPDLDPATGAINGKVAIAALPFIEVDGKKTMLGVRDCEVHLVDAADETRERVYPCGAWFQPPVGRYLFWLEQGSRVSFQSIVYYAGERFVHAGDVFMKPLYPAGFVQLDPKRDVAGGGTFRILSLKTIGSYRPFDRRLAGLQTKKHVRVPVGPFITGVFDRDGRALMLSRPQIVVAGRLNVIVPMRPGKGRAAIVAVLERFLRPPIKTCDAGLIGSNGRVRLPDVNLQAYDRIVIAWYDLPAPGDAQLAVQCNAGHPFRYQVRWEEGAVGTVRAMLRESGPPPKTR